MEMHQIRYFLAVAETLNFTRAADECHVAQPSLSRAVGKLEAELGGELFRRERGRTHLTDLGRTMLPLLRQSYDCAVAAKAQAASYGSRDFAPLRIGLSMTVELDLIGAILAELGRALPGLELSIARERGNGLLELLKAGEVELAIVGGEGDDWERFDRWDLFREGFVVVAAPDHRLAGRSELTIEDMAGEQIVSRPYCESHGDFAHLLEERAIEIPQRHEAASEADATALARRGFGLGLIPRSAAGAAGGVPVAEFSRAVRVYGVAGRFRSAAAGTLLRLLRAADWSDRSIAA